METKGKDDGGVVNLDSDDDEDGDVDMIVTGQAASKVGNSPGKIAVGNGKTISHKVNARDV